MEKKVLIFLDAWKEIKTSRILRAIDGIRVTLEMAWIVRKIRAIISERNAEIFYPSYKIQKRLSNHRIEDKAPNREVSKGPLQHVLVNSVQISRKWHQYNGLGTYLNFLGVNLGSAMQQETMNMLYGTFKSCESIRLVVDEETPDMTYIHNFYSQYGEIIRSVASEKGIRCTSIEPRSYSKLKMRVWYWVRNIYRKIKPCYEERVQLFHLYHPNRTSNSSSKATILVDTPAINYLEAIFPVLKALLEDGLFEDGLFEDTNYETYILGRESEIKRSISKYLPKSSLDFEVSVSRKTNRKYIFKIVRSIGEGFNKKDFQGLFGYDKFKLWDAIKIDFIPTLKQHINRLIPDLERFEQILASINPDVVLVGDDRGPASVRGHVLLAKTKRIPVVEIQHGLYTALVPIDTPIADRICVWGTYAKQILKGAGASDEQLVITGCPKYDALPPKRKETEGSLLSVRPKGKVLLFATQPLYEQVNYQVIECVANLFDAQKNLSLVVKPHPGEEESLYREFAKGFQKRIFVKESTEDIFELICSCDVLITTPSTVAIEAAILDKPIVLLNPDGTKSPYQIVSIEVSKTKDLIPAVKDALYNQEVREKLAVAREQFIYDHVYLLDRQASRRAAAVVKKLVDKETGN